jgi:catalase
MGKRSPVTLQDTWYLEKTAHFDREVIPERRMHAKGSGAFGTFTVTKDITKWTNASIFSEVGEKTDMFIVPGIGYSPDRMLQGRLFSYGDAQRYRLGVNYWQNPVNRSKVGTNRFHRDGFMRSDGNFGGCVHYNPNS